MEINENCKKINKFIVIDKLINMDPFDFESYIASRYMRYGYVTKVKKKSGDGGVDIFLFNGNIVEIVQCKRFEYSEVGSEVIEKLIIAKEKNRADFAHIVTTSILSRGALSLCRNNHIKVVDRDNIISYFGIYEQDDINTTSKITACISKISFELKEFFKDYKYSMYSEAMEQIINESQECYGVKNYLIGPYKKQLDYLSKNMDLFQAKLINGARFVYDEYDFDGIFTGISSSRTISAKNKEDYLDSRDTKYD